LARTRHRRRIWRDAAALNPLKWRSPPRNAAVRGGRSRGGTAMIKARLLLAAASAPLGLSHFENGTGPAERGQRTSDEER
jgi:hypothetical protein